jgi:hypothetical protein
VGVFLAQLMIEKNYGFRKMKVDVTKRELCPILVVYKSLQEGGKAKWKEV